MPPQLCHYSPLGGFHTFNTVPRDDLLEFREKKIVTWSKIRWIGWLFQFGNVLLGQELLDTQDILEQVHCHSEAATIYLVTTFISFQTLSKAYAAEFPCRFADWSSGLVARTHCGQSKNLINMTLFCFLQPQ